jgi:hypothetical protein
MNIDVLNREGDVVAVAVVDDDCPAEIAGARWGLHEGYVARRPGKRGEARPWIFLHREILGISHLDYRQCRGDHRDGDPLNNRRNNLRATTAQQNAQNRPVRTRRGTYRGVTWKKDKAKWAATGCLNYQRKHLGYFNDEEEAAQEWRAQNMTHSDADLAVAR